MMIEVLTIGLTIAGVSGWCLYFDELTKKKAKKSYNRTHRNYKGNK